MSGLARVRVTIISDTPLAAGALPLVNLVANVPFGAVYRTNHILKVAVEAINGSAPTATAPDTALHVVGYFGDANGDGRYTTADVQAILRVASGTDKAFAAWAGINPLVIADIDGNGKITSLDGSRVNQEISGSDRPEIPAIPVAPAPSTSSAPALRTMAATTTTSPTTASVAPSVTAPTTSPTTVRSSSAQSPLPIMTTAPAARPAEAAAATGTVKAATAPVRIELPATAVARGAATGSGALAPTAEAAGWLEALLTSGAEPARPVDPNEALRIVLPPSTKKEAEKTVRTPWAVAAE
jgi:hypothetical protein